jgi:nitroimidazol reductase NimA-like FMN-containing flavoprotein (pyridoxamine 5'-phosphate oxidase superfamily)
VSALAADPLARAAVAEGHRGLLATFAEFHGALDDPGEPDAETLRGAVAFLRQGVIPFAREEERVLGGRSEEAETAAFEHAFLAAEIDALAGEVAALLAAPPVPGERVEAAARVRRRADRIQAVLELHVLRGEDRGIVAPADAAPAPCEGHGRGHARPRALTAEETDALLRRHWWGTLSTVGAEGVYAVPVGYGWDGEHLYVASGPGRKARNLEADPRVCLSVAEVESGDRWRSVTVSGTAEPVTGVAATLAALNAIRRQRAGQPVTAADAARLVRAAVFRVVPREVGGRARE